MHINNEHLYQVKLPMLLSKKKSYKSVSKTDLLTDLPKESEEEKVDIFAYEEMNITQDSVIYFLLLCILVLFI